MKIILLVSIFSLSAFAQDCKKCEVYNKLTVSAVKNDEDLRKIRNLLENIELSKNKKMRSQEIQAYLQLALKAHQADPISISDEYFYDIYYIHKKDFDREIQKLKPNDRKTILETIKGVGLMRKDDKINQ